MKKVLCIFSLFLIVSCEPNINGIFLEDEENINSCLTCSDLLLSSNLEHDNVCDNSLSKFSAFRASICFGSCTDDCYQYCEQHQIPSLENFCVKCLTQQDIKFGSGMFKTYLQCIHDTSE